MRQLTRVSIAGGLFRATTPALLAIGVAMATAGESDGSRDPLRSGAGTGCARGSVSAVIAGKHTCLRVGQKCKRSLDKQYHRYRFHCHTGRLARKAAPTRSPTPTPSPPPSPPLPGPGQQIDVGGYKLYIECTGSGSPTVVFEGGQGGAAASAPLAGATGIRQEIAADTRVCAYDRAGVGASEKRPAGVASTGAQYAQELHSLLAGAAVPGPYVLVGPSYGGLIIGAFAAKFPADVAGLVFVDADSCDQPCSFGAPESGTFDPTPSFGEKPIAVLVAEFGFEGDGRGLASRSSNRILATALGSGHAIIQDQPQVVAEATRVVVSAARTGSPLPRCEETKLPQVGGRCETTG